MRYFRIITLLVLCLTLLLFNGCMTNTVTPEPASANLENQEDINQTSNNSQSSLTGLVYEPGTEELGTVYPQKWATGTGTVSNPWANGCVESAVTACPTGGTVYLRAGYYQLSGLIDVTKLMSIIGEGIGNTIIVTSDVYGIYIENVDYVTLKGFTLDGDAQGDNGCFGIETAGGCSYLLFEDLEVKNCGKYGIDNNSTNHSLFQNLYLHDNYRHGIHPGTNETGWNMYNVYRDLYLYDNGSCGMSDIGNQVYPDEDLHNVYDNIQAWGNTEHGIQITDQRSGIISNSFASDNGGVGIYLPNVGNFNIHDYSMTLNKDGILVEDSDNININNCSASGNTYNGIGIINSDNINIANCSATLNDKNGVYLYAVENINITNVIAKNNDASVSWAGFAINDSNDITLTSCQSYDDRETPLQSWGITIEGTNTGISLLNCKLSPNKNGEIYNPNGAEVTMIIEKMLAKF